MFPSGLIFFAISVGPPGNGLESQKLTDITKKDVFSQQKTDT